MTREERRDMFNGARSSTTCLMSNNLEQYCNLNDFITRLEYMLDGEYYLNELEKDINSTFADDMDNIHVREFLRLIQSYKRINKELEESAKKLKSYHEIMKEIDGGN